MTNEERRYILERIEAALAEISRHDGRAERKIKKLLKEILEVIK